MIEKNIVSCVTCGNSFNNAYKHGKLNKQVCSRDCYRKFVLKVNVKRNKEKRQKLRAEHRCIICGIKVKPIIVYNQFCSKHKQKTSKK